MNKINIIISDYDSTLSITNLLYPYLLILFNLKCTDIYERISKYIKIVFLPLFLIINFIIYLFDKNIGLKNLNFYMFRHIKKINLNETIYMIKNNLRKNINSNVLNHINKTQSDHKFIISGNLPEIISKVLVDFKVYGTKLEINNGYYTGKTLFLCTNMNKEIIYMRIIKKFKHYNIPIYVSVYGDSLNDYHMMKNANISYVVGTNMKLINRLKQENIKFELLT